MLFYALILLNDNNINNIRILYIMGILFLPNINNIITLSGALIGASTGYKYAFDQRNRRWGVHSTHVPLNAGYVGYFALFGFSLGYGISKFF